MIGICVYVGSVFGAPILEPSDYAELVNSATGLDLTEEDLMLKGRCGVNLEKAFNTIHTGFNRNDDYPPERYMKEATDSGPFKGHKCDKKEFDKMLDRFYELNEWDRITGLQTDSCLKELGLEDIAHLIEKEKERIL